MIQLTNIKQEIEKMIKQYLDKVPAGIDMFQVTAVNDTTRKVSIKRLNYNLQYDNVKVTALGAGNLKGIFVLPKVGDIVLGAYIKGQTKPVILTGVFDDFTNAPDNLPPIKQGETFIGDANNSYLYIKSTGLAGNSSVGTVPIGSVISYVKSFANTPTLPSNFVECNGQVLSDARSPYNGQTIPALNGTTDANKRFLRGSTTSGATGGAASFNTSFAAVGGTGGSRVVDSVIPTIPPYYEVVMIMRIW